MSSASISAATASASRRGNAGGRLACGVITTDNAPAPTK